MWILAQAVASSSGFKFEPGCEQNLRSAIARGLGANNVEIETYNSRIGEASANVEQLVREMIRIASAQDPGARVLHEWSLSGALSKLCPGLWPIC